eukprot:13066-Amphidinium_carterae.2
MVPLFWPAFEGLRSATLKGTSQTPAMDSKKLKRLETDVKPTPFTVANVCSKSKAKRSQYHSTLSSNLAL